MMMEQLKKEISGINSVPNVRANSTYASLVGKHSVCEGYTNRNEIFIK